MGAGAAANLPAPLYLRQSLGRCRGRSSAAHPPRAAACCPGSTRSVGPGVLRGSSGGRVDRLLPLRRRLPKDAGGEGSALQALRAHHVWQEATACILHLSARRWESCVQGSGCHIPRTCKNTSVHAGGPCMGPLPPWGLAILLRLA